MQSGGTIHTANPSSAQWTALQHFIEEFDHCIMPDQLHTVLTEHGGYPYLIIQPPDGEQTLGKGARAALV
ncbi:MAG: hypothetical protein NTAFB09_05910 [Nitrosospira sp.]